MVPKLSLHNLECWQIDLRRRKAAGYNMGEVTKKRKFRVNVSSRTMDVCVVGKLFRKSN